VSSRRHVTYCGKDLLNTGRCQRANYLVPLDAPNRLFTKNKRGRYWRHLSTATVVTRSSMPPTNRRRSSRRPPTRGPRRLRHRPRISRHRAASDSVRREPTSVASRYKLGCRCAVVRFSWHRLVVTQSASYAAAAAAAATATATYSIRPSVVETAALGVGHRFEAWRVI
jgi:hypothetical protein